VVRSRNPFGTVRTEGGLIPAELLRRVAERDGSLVGTDEVSYHLPENRKLGEAVNDSWNRLIGPWWSFRSEVTRLPPGTATTGHTREKWLLPLFAELGFGRLAPTKTLDIEGSQYPVSHVWHTVPFHLVGWDVSLDKRTSGIAGAARRSPHSLVQELLNRSEDYLWGVVTNGRFLRVLRDNAALTRQSYVEFDLEALMNGEVYGDFALLWLLLHESRFEAAEPRDSIIELWAREGEEQGIRLLDRLRDGVERSLVALGAGFLNHPANEELRRWLRAGPENEEEYYRELLRSVYRLLFLFVCEDRGLIPDPNGNPDDQSRYTKHYSVDHLRSLARRRLGGGHDDLIRGFRVVSEKLGGDAGCPELALSPLGGFLWSDRATPRLDASTISNHHFLGAIRALTVTDEGKGLRLVDYANLGSEELGSIYESLLELHAELVNDDFRLTSAPGHERRATGSYYTPTSLIVELLDSALDPMLEEASLTPEPERSILDLKVCDPAVGSGHFLVAAGHRIARRLAAVRTGDEEPSPEATRAALRDVVSHCLYGIDVNPMAVELCKVSLWLEAVDPGKPLSFLDHHIVCGNSLLGTTPRLLADGIPDDAFKSLEGDDKKIVAELRKRNKAERRGQATLDHVGATTVPPVLAGTAEAIDGAPDLTMSDIRAKEDTWRKVWANPDAEHARMLADTWCAAFVIPKKVGVPPLTEATFEALLRHPQALDRQLDAAVKRVSQQYLFMHPHLAFPNVFRLAPDILEAENPTTGWRGGFDVVLGNPPWERVKLQEKEWFAGPRPDIASAKNAATRRKLIDKLTVEQPALHARWLAAIRQSEGESHLLRESGRYPLCGHGDVNTYSVFAETMKALVRSGGRTGMIVPTGIATDDTTKAFFQEVMSNNSLVSLYDFENKKRIFRDVAPPQKFCLLTLGHVQPNELSDFVFFAQKVTDLNEPDRHFRLSADEVALLNPNTRTCPIFRSRRDAELTLRVYRQLPILVRDNAGPKGNPWSISFSSMFHMANDSGLFHTLEELEAAGLHLDGNTFADGARRMLPMYEGKLFHIYNHRYNTFEGVPEERRFRVKAQTLPMGDHVRDPSARPLPRYWIDQATVESRWAPRGRWGIAFRDTTNVTTNRRTCIIAAVPFSALNHKAPMLLVGMSPRLRLCLLGTLSSFAFDYFARQSLAGASMSFFILKQLPVPTPRTLLETRDWLGEETSAWVGSRVLELSYTSWDLKDMARDVGYLGDPFAWDDERRCMLAAELDALMFHIYGISRDEVDYILSTFGILAEQEIAESGEFVTQRVVLDRFDALDAARHSHSPYSTVLDPRPAYLPPSAPADHLP
jgi:hypothetical protein